MTTKTTSRSRKPKAVKAPKRPRLKRLNLKAVEKSLLEYPPNEQTWLCMNHFTETGTPVGMANGGKSTSCFVCRKARPKKPPLLYPTYVELCKRVGIEVGSIWKVGEQGPISRTRGNSYQPVELPLGYKL